MTRQDCCMLLHDQFVDKSLFRKILSFDGRRVVEKLTEIVGIYESRLPFWAVEFDCFRGLI